MREYLYNIAIDKSRGFVPALIRPLLFSLSLIYGLVIRILALFYGIKPYRLPCKVISVGNITLGGTGKTALVEYIARFLKGKGHKVAILTRGYKRPKTICHRPETASYEDMGDEACMLAQNLGDVAVIVDKDRIRGARQAIKDYKLDTLILDDGFQQWKIKKDLEIATIDCTKPFGNQRLLPRGILREPVSSLKRADIFILTKANLNPSLQEIKDFLSSVNPSAGIFESMHHPEGFYKLGLSKEFLGLDKLKGKKATLISGIADPDSFESLILSLGINIGLSFRFPDHHNYSQKEVENIISESQKNGIDIIITTEKDAVRFSSLRLTTYLSRRLPAGQAGQAGDLRLLALRIELKIVKNEQEFCDRLLKLYPL